MLLNGNIHSLNKFIGSHKLFHQSRDPGIEDDANPEIPGLEKGAGIETPNHKQYNFIRK